MIGGDRAVQVGARALAALADELDELADGYGELARLYGRARARARILAYGRGCANLLGFARLRAKAEAGPGDPDLARKRARAHMRAMNLAEVRVHALDLARMYTRTLDPAAPSARALAWADVLDSLPLSAHTCGHAIQLRAALRILSDRLWANHRLLAQQERLPSSQRLSLVEARLLICLAQLLPREERSRFRSEERGNLATCDQWWRRLNHLVGLVVGTPRLAWMMRREGRRRRA